MNTKSPSSLLYDFLVETVDNAPADSALANTEVLDSAYQTISADKGLVVSNAEWEFAPATADADAFDALLVIGFYRRIPGTEKVNRSELRDEVFLMAKQVTDALFAGNQNLNNRVCRGFKLLRAVDGYRSTHADSFAIVNLPIILNPTGAPVDLHLSEAQ